MPALPSQQTLLSIQGLSLTARKTVDGFLAGLNKSRIKGPGMEFSQYRSYQPGDDLRWLDWKMYARSDRYYIRESETETAISVRFLLDCTRSMLHSGDSLTKLDYARYLAASLGYLASRQGDAIALYSLGGQEITALPLRRDTQHLNRFFHALQQLKAAGSFPPFEAFRNLFTGAPKKELLVFISDFFDDGNGIMPLLHTFAAMGHEVLAFHVVAGNELKARFGGFSRLEDLETGEQVEIGDEEMGAVYEKNLAAYLAKVRTGVLSANIAYQRMQIDDPVEDALRTFLQYRNKSTR